jgi:hypothetical protein
MISHSPVSSASPIADLKPHRQDAAGAFGSFFFSGRDRVKKLLRQCFEGNANFTLPDP